MEKKSNEFIRRPIHNSRLYENQKNEEDYEKVPDEFSNKDNWSKDKKKKKSKNSSQELYKNKINKVDEINQQPTNSMRNKFNYKVKHNGIKKQNNMKISEIKNRVIANNFEKVGIYMKKKKKYHNSIDVHKSNITQRKLYKFKNEFIRQSEKQHNQCRTSDRSKNYLNNCETKNEKNNEQFEQNSTINRKYSNDCDNKNELSSSTMSEPITAITHHEQFPNTNSMKHINNENKTIINTRETKFYKNKKCSQHVNEHVQHTIDNHSKQIWNLYCHNGQNTYSMNENILNKTENSTQDKNNVKNVERTAHATSEYSKSKIMKNQTLNANDVNTNHPNQFSNLTFISRNQKRIQENQLNLVSKSCSAVKIPIHNTQKHFQSESSEEKNCSYNKDDDIPDKNDSNCKKIVTEITEENLNCKSEINSHENHEELNKNTNINREENNSFPDDFIIAFAFRVWENVIQEISGY